METRSDSEDEYVEEIIDVPYEYEVEQIVEKEVVKEEVIEKKVAQVKAMYPYKGQGLETKKGEVSFSQVLPL